MSIFALLLLVYIVAQAMSYVDVLIASISIKTGMKYELDSPLRLVLHGLVVAGFVALQTGVTLW